MFFLFVIAAWLVGVVVSFMYHNRKLPLTILILGVITIYLQFNGTLGYLGLAIMAILAAIIWIANKLDMA